MAVLSAVFLYPFVRILSNAPDSGIYLNGADLLNRGAIPSRDFVELQGPGSFVWLALFFRLFGTTLETARAVLNGTGVALALLTFYLSRRLGATGLFATVFAITIAVPLLPINSPHYDSNLFALASFAVFLLAWDDLLKSDSPAPWKLALSAFLCAIATWMLQQKGVYLATALLISLLIQIRSCSWKPIAIFGGVYAFGALLPFAFFASVHALPDVLFANYIWPLTTYSSVNAAPYGFPIWDNIEAVWTKQGKSPLAWAEDLAVCAPFLLIAVLPLLLPLAAWLSGRRWFTISLLPYWLTAYALWFSELHRMDMGHLRNGALLLIILFFAICEAGGKPFWRRLGLALTMCVALAAASQFAMSWETNGIYDVRRGQVRVPGKEPLLDFLDSHTHPGEEVFVYPYQPIYYFLEDLRNPTRYSNLTYHFNSNAQFSEATHDLERKKVRYVIFDTLMSGDRLSGVFPAYREPPKSELIMEPYLDSHYALVSDLGRFHVLERRR